MLSAEKTWTPTLLFAAFAVAFAAIGLALTGLYPGAAPLVATSLLVASLACTTGAFGLVAMRVRRLELENEGLVEEISQEFSRVKDRLEIYSEALEAPRSLTPEQQEAAERASARRVMVK